MHARSASRACVWHARAPSRHAGPHGFGPLCRTSPRTPLLSGTLQAAPPRPTGQALAAAATRQPCTMQRLPSHPGSPPGPWSSALSSTSSCRHPQPRHIALQATARRFAGELIRPPRNRPRRAIKGGPRATPGTQEALECSPSPPWQPIDSGKVFFPISGNGSRHHCPGQFGTTRASHSPFSPPRAPSSSRKPFPLLDFDRGPP